jgi:hypothetical protein
VPGLSPQPGMSVCEFRSSAGQGCGSVASVGNGRFVVADIAVDDGDIGGPVYVITGDNEAAIVGLFEGMSRSAPQLESWQAVMQQVSIDNSAQNPQQPPGVQVISLRH